MDAQPGMSLEDVKAQSEKEKLAAEILTEVGEKVKEKEKKKRKEKEKESSSSSDSSETSGSSDSSETTESSEDEEVIKKKKKKKGEEKRELADYQIPQPLVHGKRKPNPCELYYKDPETGEPVSPGGSPVTLPDPPKATKVSKVAKVVKTPKVPQVIDSDVPTGLFYFFFFFVVYFERDKGRIMGGYLASNRRTSEGKNFFFKRFVHRVCPQR
jgi:hypothetical protein